MKDIFNINKNNDENGASIIKVIRPGSDEYNEVHDTDHELGKLHLSNCIVVDDKTKEAFEEVCDRLLDSDAYSERFIDMYLNKVNANIISGKSIPPKSYALYTLFRSI